jgi:hypothetical protein
MRGFGVGEGGWSCIARVRGEDEWEDEDETDEAVLPFLTAGAAAAAVSPTARDSRTLNDCPCTDAEEEDDENDETDIDAEGRWPAAEGVGGRSAARE